LFSELHQEMLTEF